VWRWILATASSIYRLAQGDICRLKFSTAPSTPDTLTHSNRPICTRGHLCCGKWRIACRCVHVCACVRHRQDHGERNASVSGGGVSSGVGSSVDTTSQGSPAASWREASSGTGDCAHSKSSLISAGTFISAHPYQPPFEEHGLPLSADPTIEHMQELVCKQRKRPNVPPEWIDVEVGGVRVRTYTRVVRSRRPGCARCRV
jgi:hypothetical protein